MINCRNLNYRRCPVRIEVNSQFELRLCALSDCGLYNCSDYCLVLILNFVIFAENT